MTDSSIRLTPSVAIAAQSQLGPPIYPTARAHQSPYEPLNANEEEDDSTIKCICGFKHDDGSSVYCESCKTWQHIECYYWIADLGRAKSKDELDEITHLCMDCHQRHLDVHAAINRQKNKLPGPDDDEKKAKKKSHKKKKVTDTNGIVTNGWSPDLENGNDRAIRSPRDHPAAAKKPKSAHKSSNSIGPSAFLQNAPTNSHKRSMSAVQSPVRTTHRHASTQFYMGRYSDAFMHLYDDDPGDQPLRTNLHSNISMAGHLSNWATDTEALMEATHKFSHQDVFHKLEWPLEEVLGPEPQKTSREDSRVSIDGRHPRWICLTSNELTKKDTIVGELKGVIGHMTDYTEDPHNRWDDLRHPVPFVFFHPKLPIYIDTREQGTLCRYLRRSCRPNVSMTTFLENGSDYRFCFTAKEDIQPGAELTIGWTPDEHVRKFVSSKSDMTQDLSPGGEQYVSNWVSKVSPEFGGCACNSPDTCWIVRYDSEYKAPSSRRMPQSRRKTQPDHNDSSDAEDTRSSSRSDSGSRGITPIGAHGSVIPQGLDISERDKRKIAALEKSWENDKHQPATKRKKRNSGSSSQPSGTVPAGSVLPITRDDSMPAGTQRKTPVNLPSSISLPNTPGLSSRPQYVDVGTSGRKSGSPTARVPNGTGRSKGPNSLPPRSVWSHPNTPTVPSPLKANYVSIAIQTDPDAEGDWLQPAASPSTERKPYLSMTKRLLLRSQKDRQRLIERKRSSEAGSSRSSPPLQTNLKERCQRTESEVNDVSMPDGPSEPKVESVSIAGDTQNTPAILEEPKPPPWPLKDSNVALNGTQAMLKVTESPAITSPKDAVSPHLQAVLSTVTPSHPNNPTATLQLSAPAPATVQPSPIKKTINLQEYMKRKASSSAEGRTTAGGTSISSPEMTHRTLKPPVGIAHTQTEPIIESSSSAIVDTPKKEEDDPMEVSKAEIVIGPEKTGDVCDRESHGKLY